MKTFVCLVLVATCALAIPLNQEQSESTDAPSNGHYGDRIQSSTKQTAQATQNHPAASHPKRHTPASLSASTDSKTDGTSTGSSNDQPQTRPTQLKSSDNLSQTTSSSSTSAPPSANSHAVKTKRDTQSAPAVPATVAASQVPSATPKKPVTKAPIAARVTKARRDLPTSSNGATIKKQTLPIKSSSATPAQVAAINNAGQPAKAVVPAVAASTKN
ncbi:salivary glue protein Sgs-3 [Culex quinquefasciatus]|uniref:salivary glue protein Sgs-3 n=1 Tax=Culex quinquefasciatus TaxID=7176 RepID=UPI0018E326B0|nr:salivary glue protein Sgs-3 [Culex quinquefasciatus]